MTESLAAVLDAVRKRATPSADERERLAAAAETVVERATAAVADLPVEADVIRVGSTARSTWVAGDRDVDVFVRFPADLDRERLERYGLRVGHAVLPDGREEYAEHPYVVGAYDGYDVDLVPCYDVPAATAARSAVDRTPFHTEYLAERIDDRLAGEVRLCKAFLKGIGVYGSDLRTRGFSGYLVELLVLEYGGFELLVEAAADWEPPVRFDPEDHGTVAFDDPLVVIDPTDPERNVAAVCSPENVARLQHHARGLLADPGPDRFEPRDPDPYDPDDVRRAIERRGTTPVAVRFDAPDVVDDQLWPQLRRSESGIGGELDRRGFDVLRSTAMADDDAVLLFELEVARRPAVERHGGPPVSVREHAEGFYGAYAEDPDAAGPFVDGDRYVVERERDRRTAAAFLRSDGMFEVALGARVESALRAGYDVLVGEAVADLAAPPEQFGADFARYFEPKP